ncbi:MAG: hypothetical protein GXO32_07950 [Crenarchaeota archaeon]|nr:hypothetical protein [Thermoproteota archaeon]
MTKRVSDHFESKSGYWRWRVDGFARHEISNSVARLCMGPTEALYYSNAEIADGEFNDLPWERGYVEFRVRLLKSHLGSAGWGFWNHSMAIELSFPIWFIYLRARGKYPLQGFFIQVGRDFVPIKLFKSVSLYRVALSIAPWVAPIKILSSKPLAPDLDLSQWHTYRVEWSGSEARMFIDESEVARVRPRWRSPVSRFRIDVWIDNAVFLPLRGDPGAVYRHQTQENRSEACLELDYVVAEER